MSFPNKYGSSKGKALLTMDGRGFDGSVYINDTAAHVPLNTAYFTNFQALTDCVGNFASPNVAGTTTAVTVKAGTTFYGQFSSITLASGTGQAFL